MKNGVYVFWGLIILIVIGVFAATFLMKSQPGRLDSFAQCIKDKGVIFYGAFWCPHCQAQKSIFGRSAKLLPYVECSTPDGQSQLQVCKDEGIQGYPTWEFPDGTRESREMTLEELAGKTQCALPA